MKKVKVLIGLVVCALSLQVNQNLFKVESGYTTVVLADTKSSKTTSADKLNAKVTKLVKNLEKEPSKEKLLKAKKSVKKVKNKKTKRRLKHRIEKVEQVLISSEAEESVRKLENEQIQGNIAEAQTKTDRVADPEKNSELNKRIKAVADAITIRENEAESAVQNLENNQVRDNIADAQNKANNVSDTSKKEVFIDRINRVISAIETREAQEAEAAQQAQFAAQQAENQNSITVYITATGNRYHMDPNCRGLSRAKSITPTTLSEAEAQGLTRCKFE